MPQALAAKDQWYVVHVLSGQENKVKDNIEKRVKTEEMTDVIYSGKPSIAEEVEILAELIPIAKGTYLNYKSGDRKSVV